MGRFPLAAIVARRRRDQKPTEIQRSLRIGRLVTFATAVLLHVAIVALVIWLILKVAS